MLQLVIQGFFKNLHLIKSTNVFLISIVLIIKKINETNLCTTPMENKYQFVFYFLLIESDWWHCNKVTGYRFYK